MKTALILLSGIALAVSEPQFGFLGVSALLFWPFFDAVWSQSSFSSYPAFYLSSYPDYRMSLVSFLSWNSFLRTSLVVVETGAVVPRVEMLAVAAEEGGYTSDHQNSLNEWLACQKHFMSHKWQSRKWQPLIQSSHIKAKLIYPRELNHLSD